MLFNLQYFKHYHMPIIMVGIIAFAVFSACGHPGDKKQMEEYTDSFAIHYFNWQFKKAIPYCTQESEKWLRYAASNVHQEDVDALRGMEQGAQTEVGDIQFGNDDSMATVKITVKNYLRMDTIGKMGHVVAGDSHFTLPLVYHNMKWKIHLTRLPKPDKQ